MKTPNLPPWTDQAKTLLDESARDLDGATLSRLNRARQAAVSQRAPRLRQRWFVPAGLASACLLVAAVVMWQRPFMTAPAAKNPIGLSGSDADIVSGDDTLEFYQDLEFYAWLDAQQDTDS